MVFGMSRKQILKLMAVENIIISLASLLIGIATGTIFSKFIYILVVRLFEVKNIGFMLNGYSYLLTISTFVVIFTFVISISIFKNRRLTIKSFIGQGRRADFKPVRYPWLGIVGLVLLFSSIFAIDSNLKYYKLPNQNIRMLFAFGLCLIGTYIFISEFGAFIITIQKLFPKIYYKNVIASSSIAFRFKQNKKIMYIICLLSIIVVFYLGIAHGLYTGTMNQINKNYPYHIAYSEILGRNEINKGLCNTIINSGEARLIESYDVEFLYLNTNTQNGSKFMSVISEKDFNKLRRTLISKELSIEKGESTELFQLGSQINEPFIKEEYKLFSLNKEIGALNVNNYINDIIFNNSLFESYEVLIINNDDFLRFKEKLEPQFVGTHHLFKFDDWKKTKSIYENLDKELSNVNINNDFDSLKIRSQMDKMSLSSSSSGMKRYLKDKQQNSMIFYCSIFIGLMCFLSSGSIIYLKIISEISYENKKYKKLFLIGIKQKELYKLITKELATIFFTPVLIGSLIGFSIYFIFVNRDSAMKVEMIFSCLSVAVGYWLLQGMFFIFARKKYINEIIIYRS